MTEAQNISASNGGNLEKETELLNSDNVPLDAKIMALIIKSMGVKEYEPRVINLLLEFMHRYVSEVFQDALLFSEHANKQAVDIADIQLAIQSRLSQSFTQPPPREVMLDLARRKNAIPLPIVPERPGVFLPPEEFCLLKPNFQLEPKKRERQQNLRQQVIQQTLASAAEKSSFASPATFLKTMTPPTNTPPPLTTVATTATTPTTDAPTTTTGSDNQMNAAASTMSTTITPSPSPSCRGRELRVGRQLRR